MSFARHTPGRARKSSKLRIAVVEDHPAIRESVCEAMASCAEVELLPPCDDLPSGRELLARQCPDLLLVDLGLPAGPGVTLIRMARVHWGERCTSAVFSVTGTESKLMGAVEAGAKGVVFKSDPPSVWLDNARLLASGQSTLHPSMAGAMLQRLLTRETASAAQLELLQLFAAGYTMTEVAERTERAEEEVGVLVRRIFDCFQQPVPDLSPRELELLSLLNRGYPFKKCSELMGVSESTTKTQASRAYEKLGATNLQSALYEARQFGFIA